MKKKCFNDVSQWNADRESPTAFLWLQSYSALLKSHQTSFLFLFRGGNVSSFCNCFAPLLSLFSSFSHFLMIIIWPSVFQFHALTQSVKLQIFFLLLSDKDNEQNNTTKALRNCITPFLFHFACGHNCRKEKHRR